MIHDFLSFECSFLYIYYRLSMWHVRSLCRFFFRFFWKKPFEIGCHSLPVGFVVFCHNLNFLFSFLHLIIPSESNGFRKPLQRNELRRISKKVKVFFHTVKTEVLGRWGNLFTFTKCLGNEIKQRIIKYLFWTFFWRKPLACKDLRQIWARLSYRIIPICLCLCVQT